MEGLGVNRLRVFSKNIRSPINKYKPNVAVEAKQRLELASMKVCSPSETKAAISAPKTMIALLSKPAQRFRMGVALNSL